MKKKHPEKNEAEDNKKELKKHRKRLRRYLEGGYVGLQRRKENFPWPPSDYAQELALMRLATDSVHGLIDYIFLTYGFSSDQTKNIRVTEGEYGRLQAIVDEFNDRFNGAQIKMARGESAGFVEFENTKKYKGKKGRK